MADKKSEEIENEDRLSAEDWGSIEDRVAKLDAVILRSMVDRREASIKAGLALIELKEILRHGKFQRHVEEMFASFGVTLRTAERYMKRARKAEADAKNDSVSGFKEANDRNALEKREAAKREIEVRRSLIATHKTARLYKLPLHMTSYEMFAVDALQASSDWSHLEKRIVRRLRRICVGYGLLKNEGEVHENASAEA